MYNFLKHFGDVGYKFVVGQRKGLARWETLRWLHKPVEKYAGSDTGPVLFVVAEASVVPHFVAHCLLAKTLQEAGHDVLVTLCHGMFNRCPTMETFRLPKDATAKAKANCCLDCTGTALKYLRTYGLPWVDLRNHASSHAREKAAGAIREFEGNLYHFEYDGISFGKIAAMDLVLARKVSNFDELDELTTDTWRTFTQESLCAYLLFGELINSTNPSAIVHFNDYSLLLGARMAAEKRKVAAFSISQASHRNIDRRRILIRPEIGPIEYRRIMDDWPRWRDLPLNEEQILDVGEDVLLRLRAAGSHTFSTAKTVYRGDPRESLGLQTDKKLIVAFTSSLDEKTATRMTTEGAGRIVLDVFELFPDQSSWIKCLAKFVAKNQDWQLAVRVHPREGGGGKAVESGKVHAIASQHLQRLKAELSEPMDNVKIFWPEDPVSSYDLGELANVVANSWSTIGLEMARLGAPVLAYTEGIGPFVWDDFVVGSRSEQDFVDQIEKLDSRGCELETLAKAFRFYHLIFLGNAVAFDDLIPAGDPLWKLPKFERPQCEQDVVDALVNKRDLLDIRMENFQKKPTAADTEAAAIRSQCRRFVWFLMTGESADTLNFEIESEKPILSILETHSGSKIEVTDNWVSHSRQGKLNRRYSPQAARLIRALAK